MEIRDGGVAEIAGVLGVEWNRRSASKLIANRFVDDCHFDTALLEAQLNLVFDLPAQIDLGDPDVSLRIAIHVLEFFDLARTETLDQCF